MDIIGRMSDSDWLDRLRTRLDYFPQTREIVGKTIIVGVLAGAVVKGLTTGDFSPIPDTPSGTRNYMDRRACHHRDPKEPLPFRLSLVCNGGYADATTSSSHTNATVPGSSCHLRFTQDGTRPGTLDPNWKVSHIEGEPTLPTNLESGITAAQFTGLGQFACLGKTHDLSYRAPSRGPE